jgi:hypothetical protein
MGQVCFAEGPTEGLPRGEWFLVIRNRRSQEDNRSCVQDTVSRVRNTDTSCILRTKHKSEERIPELENSRRIK